jgi:hypothetical protein
MDLDLDLDLVRVESQIRGRDGWRPLKNSNLATDC